MLYKKGWGGMNVVIGYWLIALAITILFVVLEPFLTTKEKVKLAVCIMVFITLISTGVYLMVGGAE